MSEPITYGAIEKALVQLGFDITAGPDYRLYRHEGTNTVIITPDYPLSKPLSRCGWRQSARWSWSVGWRGGRGWNGLNNPPAVSRPVAVKKSTVRITHEIPAEVKA